MNDDCNGGTGTPTTLEKCRVDLTGYVECCCSDPEPRIQNLGHELFKLPCATTCDEAYNLINNFLTSNPGSYVTAALDFHNDGWLLVISYPTNP